MEQVNEIAANRVVGVVRTEEICCSDGGGDSGVADSSEEEAIFYKGRPVCHSI